MEIAHQVGTVTDQDAREAVREANAAPAYVVLHQAKVRIVAHLHHHAGMVHRGNL